MDLNVRIPTTEQSNKGDKIYLYHLPQAPVWSAYGQSAYALRLYAKNHGYGNLRGYSKEYQMPCTVVGEETVKRMCTSDLILDEGQNYYLTLTNPLIFDHNDYIRWTAKLRTESAEPHPLNIETHISSLVPKDRFIKDNMSAFARNGKRIVDCIISLILMLVFSPLFLVCYISVRREDGGPAIFKQERIGRFGKPFHIYKFRTMRLDAESMGPQLSSSGGNNDPRLTRIGRFLRAHHLDELPQLWNVFIGDMTFIGPRPERKFYIDQILEYDQRYTYLYQIRPGVTSYATLYNGYTDTMEKMLRRLEYDLYYLGHRSLWLDCKILTKTFFSIIFGKIF